MVETHFKKYGFPLILDSNVVSNDPSTLFICAGMQPLKSKFEESGGGTHGSIQTCIRTNDLDLIGDGSHLSSFEMIGNFSFNGIPYHQSCLMWDEILADLELKKRCIIHVHPDKPEHEVMWKFLGFKCVLDSECKWTDGNIGGYCCEVYVDDLEIGNLVNPLGHSTDVGFGLERMLQVIEGVDRIDKTSVFNQEWSPVVRDLHRTLLVLKQNQIYPGDKGRRSVCRRLLRKLCDETNLNLPEITDWMKDFRRKKENTFNKGIRLLPKFPEKPLSWWWDTHGISESDLDEIRKAIDENKRCDIIIEKCLGNVIV